MRYDDEMRMAGMVLVLLGLGCGGDDEAGPEERLIGSWVVDVGTDCAAAYVFGADGEYEQQFVCFDSDPTIDVEIYGGDWSADAAYIYLSPKGGSCDADEAGSAAQTASIAYTLLDGGETLRIGGRSGTVLYSHVEDDGMPGSGGAIIQFGCYTDAGFEPRDVQRF